MENRMLNIEVELIKLFRDTSESARVSIDPIAAELRKVSAIAKSNELPQWIGFQKSLSSQLKYMEKIYLDYQEMKTAFILKYQNSDSKLFLDNGVKLELDKRANCLILYEMDQKIDVL